jgi:DNA topoisomerase-3
MSAFPDSDHHHAVIPNVNTIDKLREVWPRLSSDEKKLFDVIARAYLAALMPDFRYRQTTATLDVRGFEFRASGRQPIDLGWRAAFPKWQPADEKGDEAQLLPPLRNGETAQLRDPKIEDKETRPPPRYNEGTLIEAMQNAWRFVDDEVLQERLKEAKGIGTPATRALRRSHVHHRRSRGASSRAEVQVGLGSKMSFVPLPLPCAEGQDRG